MARAFDGIAEREKSAPKKKSGKNKKDNPTRAQLIENALAIHRKHGNALRRQLDRSLQSLAADKKVLRDPDELARLMALAHARRSMGRLMAGDLRRYLVLSGVRELLEPDAKKGTARVQRPPVSRR